MVLVYMIITGRKYLRISVILLIEYEFLFNAFIHIMISMLNALLICKCKIKEVQFNYFKKMVDLLKIFIC